MLRAFFILESVKNVSLTLKIDWLQPVKDHR